MNIEKAEENFPLIANYSFQLTIDSYTLKVTYCFRFLNGFPFDDHGNVRYLASDKNYHHVHFQFFGITASETGYRSYFCNLADIQNNPFHYASLVAEYLYQEVKKKHPERFTKQLSLF